MKKKYISTIFSRK